MARCAGSKDKYGTDGAIKPDSKVKPCAKSFPRWFTQKVFLVGWKQNIRKEKTQRILVRCFFGMSNGFMCAIEETWGPPT